MKNKENNPFDIILSETPNFSEKEAIHLAKKHYDIESSAENLVSERDQNFLLTTKNAKLKNWVSSEPTVTTMKCKS